MNASVPRHSHLAHAAYLDLVRLLREEEISDIRGKPLVKPRGSVRFWYDNYRVGNEVRSRYIGPDTPEIRSRIERLEELRQAGSIRRSERARLVRVLRAENFLSLDAGTGSLLAAFAAAGTFRLGGTLVGTQAFRLYEGELGVRLKADQAIATDDIDIASFERLSVAIEDTTSPKLAEVLSDFAFSPVPSLDKGRVWKWRQSTKGTLVEFLTPSFDAAEGLRDLPALGVAAQSLHYLNYLIAEPIAAAVLYRSGVLVQLPRPERFAIHKLIVADRRAGGPNRLKSQKDLTQADVLIRVLKEDRPDDLREAYELALANGPQWRKHMGASLEKLPAASAALSSLKVLYDPLQDKARP